MEINPELIQKVFEKNCTPEERAAVLHHLSQHPEEVKRLLPFSEWETINDAQPLPEEVSATMLYDLRKKLFPSRMRWLLKAAAVLIPLIGITMFLCTRQHRAPVMAVRLMHRPVKDTNWIYRRNDGAKTMAVTLPDGSLVRLSRSAVLKYPSLYGVHKRDVYLEGQAFFDVARQSGKPFTVFTEKIRTVVLGTTFSVTAGKRNIAVKLFSGKVMVSGAPGHQQDIYLAPGEQLSYDKISEQVLISKNQLSSLSALAAIKEDSALHFNNASLQEVVEKLSDTYHFKIVYNRHQVAGMNFTGTVSHTDSLSVILRIIANMNDLNLQRTDSTFTLSKPH